MVNNSPEWKRKKAAIIGAFSVTFLVLFAVMSSNENPQMVNGKRVAAAGVSAGKIFSRAKDSISQENNEKAASIEQVKEEVVSKAIDVVSEAKEEVNSWPALQPLWGYATNRNVARWEILSKELNKIVPEESAARSWFIDYGADQGYFTVNTAKHFANHKANVLAVEKGGNGGSFWLKKDSVDVYSIIDKKAQEFNVGSAVQLCPIEVNMTVFQQLKDAACIADGQMLLSMLHWVKIDGRKEFNIAMKLIASLAKTTLIELPSPYAKTCIYDFRYHGWYDGRKDLNEILREALEGSGATFVEAGRTPWTTMTRSIYRIDSNQAMPENRRELSDPVCQNILACRSASGDV